MSNGTCRLVMSFCDSIPSSVSVADFSVRVFHAGQPVMSLFISLWPVLFRLSLHCPYPPSLLQFCLFLPLPFLLQFPVTAVSTPVSTSVPPSSSVISVPVPVLSHSIGASSSQEVFSLWYGRRQGNHQCSLIRGIEREGYLSGWLVVRRATQGAVTTAFRKEGLLLCCCTCKLAFWAR